VALIAGLHGSGGREITAVANALRGRDDQNGCPVFALSMPFDSHPFTG
jgi:hypothetical protein